MTLHNRLLGSFFVLLALPVLWSAWHMPAGAMGDPGPAVYPATIALLMIPLGLLLAFQRDKRTQPAATPRDEKTDTGHRPALVRGVLLLVLTGLFIGSLDYLGVLLSTVSFLWLAALLLGKRSARAALIYLVASCLIGGLAYVVFVKVLHLTLPSGLFF